MKKLIYMATISTLFASGCLGQEVQTSKNINAVGCAKTKKLAITRAKDNLAIKLAPKPKKSLNPGFSSFPMVADNINLKVKVIEYYTKPNGDVCVKVIKKCEINHTF